MREEDPRILVEPSLLAKNNFWLSVFIILLCAFLVRSFDIDNRPLHNDEGVNFFFIEQVEHKGYYPYSHENYHGPSYFYLTKSFVDLFGVSDFSLRFSAIFCGLLLVALALTKRRDEGDLYVILALLFLAASSSSVFYSRYAIHETLFLLSGAALGFCLFEWGVNKSKKAIYLGALSLAVLIATKETFIITIFCLGLAYLSLGNLPKRLTAFWDDRAHIFAALALVVIIIIAFFTGGFKWFDGLREMFLAVPQWLNRNEADYGHHKPFWYYTEMILSTEPQVLLAIISPLLFLIVYDIKFIKELATKEALWIRFLSVWGFSAWTVYSFVKYKTPWLVINITLPFSLASAWWLALMFRKARKFNLTAIIFSLLTVSLGSLGTYYYVFEKPYGPGNPFSYVHTGPGFLEMMDLIEDYRSKHKDSRVLIGQTGYWPMPYYVRDYVDKVAYLRTDEPAKHTSEYDIIIVDHTVDWSHPEYAKRYFRASDVGEIHVYLRRR